MFLNFVLIGNVISFIGMSFFVLSSLAKTKKSLLSIQSISHILNAIAEAFTKQFAGIVQDLINLIRNIVVMLNKNNKFISIFLITLGFSVGIIVNYFFNNNDLIGYLPVFATLMYSIIVMIPNINIVYIKLTMIVSSICWATYSFFYLNYVMGAFNVVSVFVTISQIIMIMIKKKKD